MKKVYLVLGEWHVGKSTLIRMLTGVTRQTRTKLRLTSGVDIDLYVWIRSMQEDNPVMTPEDLIQDLTSQDEKGFEYYLIPIRTDSLNGISGQAYIDLLHAKCNIVGVILLSNGGIAHHVKIPTPFIHIANTKSLPPNHITSRVRRQWGWE
jgi:hypothetical protein